MSGSVTFSLGEDEIVEVSVEDVAALKRLMAAWWLVDEVRIDLPDGSHATWAVPAPPHGRME